MKKTLFILMVLIILNSLTFSYGQDLNLIGESAVLMDFESKSILYEKEPDKKLYPASTTKIMTGILAIEFGNLTDIVTIDQEVVDLTDGSHIALEPGEQLTLEQLLNALLIESANDAAVAIAKHISGSVENFAALMNNKAKELGAKNTNFVNPSGLHDENHYTSARDLALIGRYAMENNVFRDIVKNYTYIIPITNKKSEPRYLKSANKLLYSTQKIVVDGQSIPIKYDGVNGVKTGYTSIAKNSLVATVNKDGNSFISVVLSSDPKGVFSDTHQLFNYGFKNFEKVEISKANRFISNINIKNGLIPFVPAIVKDDVYININKLDKEKVKENIVILEDLEAPISKDQPVGSLEYTLDGKVIASVDIVSTTPVAFDENTRLIKKLLNKWYLFVFGIMILLRFNKVRKMKLKRKRRLKQKTK